MLERVFNRLIERGLTESPRAAQLCAALAGHSVEIVPAGLPWTLLVSSTGTTLTLKRALRPPAPQPPSAPDGSAPDPTPRVADASVSGSIVALLSLAASDAQAVIRRGDARIDGDVDVAQRFRELALLLRPDIEALLADLLGQLPAHALVRVGRDVLSFGRNTAMTAAQNVGEYLLHERGAMVSKAESEGFSRAVEALNDQVERMDARLQALQLRGQRLAGAPDDTR